MEETVERFTLNVPPPCRTNECEEDGCRLSLTECPRPYSVGDTRDQYLPVPVPARGEKRSDYVIVGSRNKSTWVAVVELKGGRSRPNINKIVSQIKGGCKIADRWIPEEIEDFDFLPLLVYSEEVQAAHFLRLRQQRVRLRNETAGVETALCGDRLASVLSRALW